MRKLKINSKFITSSPWKLTVTIHSLPKISKKVIRTMNFVQLIEYNMKSLFLKKWYTKSGGETSPVIEHTSIFLTGCYFCMPSRGLPKYSATKLLTLAALEGLFLPHTDIYQKNKTGLELPYFLQDFTSKILSSYIRVFEECLLPDCLYFLWDIRQYITESTLAFLIEQFSCIISNIINILPVAFHFYLTLKLSFSVLVD